LTLICIILFTTIVDAKDNCETKLVSVSIEKGDTLWRLASRYAEKNIDIRDYINEVIAINELKTVNIKPGQILYFPQY
jgi:LysM repeat protein